MFDSGLALQRYLRALWGIAPQMHFDVEAPFIDGGVLHLAPGSGVLQRAAAAHAAAHLVFSPPVFEGEPPGPIVRALIGLLEDARVEALAARALPGLRRLWMSLHAATPADGGSVEALLRRLARVLADPDCADPHPWVCKGRALFFLDDAGTVLALQRPEQLRVVASLLGNDLGQMRLQFNSRLYLPAPAYRDDHRWMWAQRWSDEAVVDEPATAPEPPTTAVPPGPTRRYAEQAARLARLRKDWCTVGVEMAPEATIHVIADPPRSTPPLVPLLARHSRRRRALEGDSLDTDAAVEAGIALRLCHPVDARVWCGRERARRRGAVTVLVDQSASTSARWGTGGQPMLVAATHVAARLATSFDRAGIATAIASFSSNGRHAVRVQTIKSGPQRVDVGVHRRLAGLRAIGSTRLGPVLRDVVARRDPATRLVLIIGDGELHDIDVHQRGYLEADARHAVREATRLGLTLACVVLDPAHVSAAVNVFGARRVGVLQSMSHLQHVLRRIATH